MSAGILVEFVNNYCAPAPKLPRMVGLCCRTAGAGSAWPSVRYGHAIGRKTLQRVRRFCSFALALVTAAIPIQLRFYGIPIGWSVEALLLGFVGQRYRNWQFQLGAFVATLLAALGLVARLPLHEALFTPVFNRPFGSWMTVIGMTFVLSAVLQKNQERLEGFFKQAVSAVFWLGVILTCTLAHLEIATFWTVRSDRYAPNVLLSHELTSLAILWSAIPLVLIWLGRDRSIRASVPGALIAYFIGILILLINATSDSWIVPNIPFLNIQWISRVLVAVSLWVGTYWMLSARNKPADMGSLAGSSFFPSKRPGMRFSSSCFSPRSTPGSHPAGSFRHSCVSGLSPRCGACRHSF